MWKSVSIVDTPTWQTESIYNGDRLSTLQPALRLNTAEDQTFMRVAHTRPDAIQLQWVMSMSSNCEQWHEHCFCHVISWLGADYGTSGLFKACVRRANLYRRGLAQSPSRYCGQRQTMSHIVDTCPLTKFEGGLNLLHEADDDAVIRLESTATAALTK